MGRIEKLKRQAIQEANKRNLGILTEQEEVGALPPYVQHDINLSPEVEKVDVKKQKRELEEILEILEYEVEQVKNKKSARKAEIKDTLKTIRGNRKLSKTIKKKEKELSKLEGQLENLEDTETFKEKRKNILKKIFLTIYLAIGGVIAATDPRIKDKIEYGKKAMDNIVSSL